MKEEEYEELVAMDVAEPEETFAEPVDEDPDAGPGTPYPDEPKKGLNEITQEVRKGLWGSGQDRRRRLSEAGYDHRMVQQELVRQANSRANL